MEIATVKEVANYFKLTNSTVYKLATAGKLSAFRIGNSWRFDMDQIMRQVEETKGAGRQKAEVGAGKRQTRSKKANASETAPAK